MTGEEKEESVWTVGLSAQENLHRPSEAARRQPDKLGLVLSVDEVGDEHKSLPIALSIGKPPNSNKKITNSIPVIDCMHFLSLLA